PLTWFFKIPLRGILTAIYGYKLVKEGKGFQAAVEIGKQALDEAPFEALSNCNDRYKALDEACYEISFDGPYEACYEDREEAYYELLECEANVSAKLLVASAAVMVINEKFIKAARRVDGSAPLGYDSNTDDPAE